MASCVSSVRYPVTVGERADMVAERKGCNKLVAASLEQFVLLRSFQSGLLCWCGLIRTSESSEENTIGT